MTTPYDSTISQVNTLVQQSQQALVQSAEKKYYTFVGGTAGYSDYITKELGTKADSIITKIKNEFSKIFSSAKALTDAFSTQLINSQYAEQVYDKYLEENEALENELKDNSYDIFTNDRKTYYEDQGVDNLKWWSTGFSVFYWILVVAYIICFFISSSGFSVLSRMLILLFLIIYPFIASQIFNYIISIFYRISSVLPRNSYLHN